MWKQIWLHFQLKNLEYDYNMWKYDSQWASSHTHSLHLCMTQIYTSDPACKLNTVLKIIEKEKI
jgi:hypothetical protein